MGDHSKQLGDDNLVLVRELLRTRGLVREHLDSFNYFVKKGIQKIVRANDLVVSTTRRRISVRFSNVRIGKPSVKISEDFSGTEDTTPMACRLSNQTYAAPIIARVEYNREPVGQKKNKKKQAPEEEEPDKIMQNNVVIGRMPVMLRSCRCVLYGQNEDELKDLGECPLDPGGYFVIKGREKVIWIQEHDSENRIVVDTDKEGNFTASVTSSTEEAVNKTVIVMKNHMMWLQMKQFAEEVPLIIVMKAMGMVSHKEILQMMGRDIRISLLLQSSLLDCEKKRVNTQEEALKYLDSKVKDHMYANISSEEGGRAFAVLRDVFLANVPVYEDNLRPKCIYLAVMMRRMMNVILKEDTIDDKNYVGHIRLALSGQLISLFFENTFKAMTTELKKRIDKEGVKRPYDMILSFFKEQFIAGAFERTFFTGNLNVKRFQMERIGTIQELQRSSFIASLGQLTRITPQSVQRVRQSRHLNSTQLGMFCPLDTPLGEDCGLVKNLALLTRITTDEEAPPLISLCYSLGVEAMEHISEKELHEPNSFLVMFNGLILGKHAKPRRFVTVMRNLRRAGEIGAFVSVYVNEKERCVYLASDGGRVCRPYIIADKGVSRVKKGHMIELQESVKSLYDLNLGGKKLLPVIADNQDSRATEPHMEKLICVDDFLRAGLIEYLDVNEQNNALIALYEKDATSENTHIEIESFTTFGISAGIIPYANHNHCKCNIYQCAIGRNSMGNIAFNQLKRMDRLLNLLVYPQRPLLTTETIELVGYDKLGGGQNAVVAVMSYSGYDMMDAIVMNKSSLDRGFGRSIFFKKYTEISQDLLRPDRTGESAGRMQILDDDGLVPPGELIRQGDVYIYKQTPMLRQNIDSSANLPVRKYLPTEQTFKGQGGEVVDRVALLSNKDKNLCINFVMRHTRRPEVGDKFSTRHGLKGVIGTIVQQEDLPFSEKGIYPDLIMNPHGFQGRMTVGNMMELLGGKAGVSCGRFHYGSAFGETSGHADKVETISETLVNHGFNYGGKDFLYSGITGCPLQAYIFMGPIYYQKLKHMVLDKMRARGNGPRDFLTRQPTEGKAIYGGLRIGERERDSLIAYGASMLIFERLMLSSDPFEVQVCRSCGLLGYYNYELKTGVCPSCKNGDQISNMKLPYACKLLIQELQSMNIVPRLKLADPLD